MAREMRGLAFHGARCAAILLIAALFSGSSILPADGTADDIFSLGGRTAEVMSPSERSSSALSPNPPVRAAHEMAYDAAADRTILFGGWTTGEVPLDDTWAYDLNSKAWSQRNPAVAPPPRITHAMAYDSESDAIVLFGGDCCATGIAGANDTWVYDPKADTWIERRPVVAPPPRVGHRMAYDSRSDRLVLFGGYALSGTWIHFNDTWLYDLNTDTWTDVAPVEAPPARAYAGFAYDSQSDRFILFGGRLDPDSPLLSDTWAYNPTTSEWTNMNPIQKPPAQWLHDMAYDSESDRVVLFGAGTSETWAYDYNTNAWTNVNPTLRPSSRFVHRMAYDSESDRVILFGGEYPLHGDRNNETWAYDFNSNEWTPLTRPSAPRTLAAVAGDSRVDLSWLPPASSGGVPIANYRIYRGTASGVLTLLIEVGNVLSHEDSAVTNGVAYYYQVSAVTAAGEGEWSIEDFTTPLPTLSPLAVGAVSAAGIAAAAVVGALLIRRRRRG